MIKLRGKRSLRFREAFAVTPVVSCDRPCRGRLTGRKVGPQAQLSAALKAM